MIPLPIHTVLHSDTTDCKHNVHMLGCIKGLSHEIDWLLMTCMLSSRPK
jgi:hypothetical protein